jgi:hypothetical protein
MDIVSVILSFLVGTATGATGTYYGTKFTEKRKKKESDRAKKNKITNIELKMPELFEEMRKDLKDPKNNLMRNFYLLKRSEKLNTNDHYLAYHYEDYKDLDDQILLLQDNALITDITEMNVKKYRFNEELVEYLLR